MPESLTRQFAAVLHEWPADDPLVIHAARLLILDGLSIAFAGSRERGPTLLAAQAPRIPDESGVSLIGHRIKATASVAARVNGTSMHVLDYEPMWSPSNHAVSTTLPALLAVAEELENAGAPPQGLRVARALAKGIEAQARLRVAANQPHVESLTFHPPGIVGPIESAIAVADLLELDIDATTAAIGIAASCAGGLLANSGTMTKALHCGNAAMAGLEAASLARAGFTADADVLGHRKGYANAYFGGGFDASALTCPIDVPRILKPGPAWKLFPSQYGTHFVISAALACRVALASVDDIRRVTIRTPVYPYLDRPSPLNGLDGKFSFQYCAAVALLDGQVSPASFTDERRFEPRIEAMLERIDIVVDPKLDAAFERMSVELTLQLNSGVEIVRVCDAPDGSWTRPVSPQRLEQKARELTVDRLGPAAFERFWSMANNSASFSVTALMQLFAHAHSDDGQLS
ncbi:MmgE/PrpD family protein [Paraburkholderia caffeinilytica]